MENILIDGELYNSETGELINEVEQIEVDVIENTLPDIICNGGTHIKTNTIQLKKELAIYLAKYDVEVTEDTEKDCSKMATELNKLAGNLDKKRKETAAIIKKPADELKIAIDELIAIVQEKRTSILDGVNVFKQKRFETIRNLLKARLNVLYIENKIKEKYRTLDIEPLVVEGSLAKVALSKNAIESLESMVKRVALLQSQVEIRTLELKIKCDNAGLITPIELDEVQNIIENENYNELLEAIINKRLELQDQVKKQLEQQEQKKQELIKEEEFKKQQQKENEEKQQQQKVIEQQKQTGKKIVKLVATFEVEVNADVVDNKVWSKYVVELQKQFSTFVNLEIK